MSVISSINIRDDNGRKCITLLFVIDNDLTDFKSIVKEFYFEYADAVKFYNILKYYLNKLKIPINYQLEDDNSPNTQKKIEFNNGNTSTSLL